MKKKTIIISAILLAAGLDLSAQTPDSLRRVMNLHDCMEYAVSNSTKMKLQQTEVSDAQVTRRESIIGAFTPDITAGTYLYSNFGRTVDPETNTYISSTSLNNGYSVSAGITLFNGFQAINGMKVAKTALKMGLSKEQQIKDEVCLATMQAYCNVVFCTKMTDVLQSFVENARKNLELARRQKELGQKGKSEVIQMEAELADREYELVTMENNRKDALLTLKDMMLWPVSEELLIDVDQLDACSGELIPQELCDFAAIAGQAKEGLPAAQLARGRMQNAKTEWNTARWSLAPSLSLNGGWSTSYYTYPGKPGYVTLPFGQQFMNNGGEYLQLSLTIPIFNGWSRQSHIARKKNEYRRASYEYEQTLHNIETEVARALQDRDGAQAALDQARRRSEVQEEAYHLNREKMARGLISSIEFQTASNLYLKAEAECLDARLKYLLKDSVVKFYKGISYLNQ